MSPNPSAFLQHLRKSGYHPRSDKHSNALAQAIVDDLLQQCPRITEKSASGAMVYDLNFSLRAGTAEWNVDLVLGAAEQGTPPPPRGSPISRHPPSMVEIAIEIESVMTEHHKAVKNRKRDLEAHHEHVHHYNDRTIAGGVLVINSAARFRSPLRSAPVLHRSPEKLVEHCLSELRSVATRGGEAGLGLDAKCAIVVDFDNMDFKEARFLTRKPAPRVGDPLHYDAFIKTICQHYVRRF